MSSDFRESRKRQLTVTAILYKFLKRFDQAVLDATDGKRVFNSLMMNRQDQLRLFNLASWEEQYAVELSYIIATLFEYYTKIRRGANIATSSNRGLGIRVATLVGEASKKALEQKILLEYPQFENVSGRFHQKIVEALSTPALTKRYAVDDAKDFVASYAKRIAKQKKKYNVVVQEMKTKRFRGNTTEK